MNDDVIILAGGWSVSQFNLRGIEERGKLVAVNDAAIFTKPYTVVTRDRMWLEGRFDLLRILGVPSIWAHEGIVKQERMQPHLITYKSAPTVREVRHGLLYDSNSGSAALSLAYHMRPKRVFLLGFDMQRGPNDEKHWYPDYTWAYTTKPAWFLSWAEEFDAFAGAFREKGIEVLNVTSSTRTRITSFPIIDFREFVRMT